MDFKHYFNVNKQVIGTLLDENGEKIYTLEGELHYNKYKPEDITLDVSLFDSDKSKVMGVAAYEGLSRRSLKIISQEERRSKRLIFNVSVKKATWDGIIFSVNQFYEYQEETVNYKMMHSLFNPEKIEEPTLFFVWYLHQFQEQGMVFDPMQHNRRGLVFGYDFEIDQDFEEGSWNENAIELNLAEHLLTFQPNMFIKEIEQEDAKSYYVLPELSGRISYTKNSFPDNWNGIQKEFEKINSVFEPVRYALRFITGSKIDSFNQSLFYYNPKTKRYCAVEKITKERIRKSKQNLRQHSYGGFWDLIEEFSKSFMHLDKADRKRVKRSIERFNEAFEAPFLELRLTLLHSALSLLLDKKEYTDSSIEIDHNLPQPDGTLPWHLANYITIKDLKWEDLLEEDQPKKEFFAFNNLRNKYLKDLEHDVTSYSPVRILHRMFERVLITELGLDFAQYEDMLGNF